MNVKEDMLKKKKEINEKTEIFIFVFLAFILLTIWAMTQPFNSGPDEQMRYYVADYIYKHHGALPRGDDPAVRNKVWGISYAYYPVVSYMVSALFMRISRLFADPGYSMFKIARMADVLFVTGAVYFVVKASGKLFPKEKYSGEVRWLFYIIQMNTVSFVQNDLETIIGMQNDFFCPIDIFFTVRHNL